MLFLLPLLLIACEPSPEPLPPPARVVAVEEPERTPGDLCREATGVMPDMLYVPGEGYVKDIDNPVVVERLNHCTELVARVWDEGEDKARLVVSMAYVETNFNPDAIGGLGERGMLQVRPEFHCVGDFSDGQGGCVDPEGAGLLFLDRLTRTRTPHDALVKYNGSGAYARKVLGYVQALTGSA